MVLNGRYAIYKGKEYKAGNDMKGGIWLFSEDAEDLKSGFTPTLDGERYKLHVEKSEVEHYFSRQLYCEFRGRYCSVVAEDEDTYRIQLTGCVMPEEKAELDEVDRGVFQKTVKKSEVTNVRYSLAYYK